MPRDLLKDYGASAYQPRDLLAQTSTPYQPKDLLARTDSSYGDIAVSSVKSVLPSYGKAAGGLLRAAQEVPAAIKGEVPKSDTTGKAVADYWDKRLKDIQPDVEAGTAKYYVSGILHNVAQNVPWLAAAILSRSRVLPLAGFGLTAAGTKYQDMREQGASVKASAIGAGIIGVSEVATELPALGILIKPGMKFAKRIIMTAAFDVPGELINTIIESSVDKVTIRPDMTAQEFGEALVDTAIISLGSAGLLSTISHPLVRAQEKAEKKAPPTDLLAERPPLVKRQYDAFKERHGELAALDMIAETEEGMAHFKAAPKEFAFRVSPRAQEAAPTEAEEAPVTPPEAAPVVPGAVAVPEFESTLDSIIETDADLSLLDRTLQKLIEPVRGEEGAGELVTGPEITEAPDIETEADFIDLSEASLEPVLANLRGTRAPTAKEFVAEFLHVQQEFVEEFQRMKEDIQRIANSVYAEGKTSLKDFTQRMKVVLKDVYEKFKDVIQKVWESAKAFNERYPLNPLRMDERGSIGGRGATEFGQATGKFSSLADRKERFEIDDSKATIETKPLWDFIDSPRQFKRLGEVLKHEELYKNYPQLANMPIAVGRINANAAVMDASIMIPGVNIPPGKGWRIVVGHDWFQENIAGEDPKVAQKRLLDALMHEVQHFIQETEGFAVGGSPQLAAEISPQLKARFDKFFNAWSLKKALSKGVPINVTLKEHSEIGMPISQESIDLAETTSQTELKTLQDKALRVWEKFSVGGVTPLSPLEVYKRLAGEIEAREVESRISLTPEERRATLIYAEQGVPLAQWIVLKGGTKKASFSIGEGGPKFNLESYMSDLEDLVVGGEPGGRIFDEETGDVTGFSSTYPDFMKNMGWSRKEVLAAFKNITSKKPLTHRQQDIVIEAASQALDIYFRDAASQGIMTDALATRADKVMDKFIKGLEAGVPVKPKAPPAPKIAAESELKKVLNTQIRRTWALEDALSKSKEVAEEKKAEHQAKITALKTEVKVLKKRVRGLIVKPRKPTAKQVIRQETGQVKDPEYRNLAIKLKAQASAARKAKREGRLEEAERVKAEMRETFARGKERLAGRAEVRKLKAQIKKEVKTTRVKKQAGKPRGKFTADFQKIFDTWSIALKTPPEVIARKLMDATVKYLDSNEIPSQAELVRNRIYSMVLNIDKMEAGELRELLSDIKEMKSEGRLMRALEDSHYEERIETMKETVKAAVAAGEELPEGVKTTGMPQKKMTWDAWLKTFPGEAGYYFVGWQDLMDIMSGKVKGETPYQGALNQMADVRSEENAEKAGRPKWTRKFAEMAWQTFGFKSDHEMMARFNKDKDIVTIGTFVNAEGQRSIIEMSRAQARKRYMEMLDPSLNETFIKGMAYTDEIKKAIEGYLTEEDKVFAQAQLDLYREYYDGVNEVYRQIYGTDLPFNEFYSPIRREGVSAPEGVGFGEMMQEVSFRASVAPAATKARVKNIRRIAEQNDLNVFEKHIAEMEHFKAWATKIRELNAVFNDSEVKALIRQHYGPHMNSVIEHFLKKFTRGGTELSTRLDLFDKWRSRMTRSVLAVKPAILLKQLTSTVAYAEKMPVKDFVKYTVAFWANPVKNFKFLKNSSVMFEHRGQYQERDIRTALTSREYQSFMRTKSFMDMLMLNVQIGDQGAIAVGGWAYYKYLTSKGMSHESAIKEFENFTAITQQSADLSDLSVIQSMGSLAKLFTVFMSATNLYMRKEYAALRGLVQGRGSKKQHIKALMIYHLLIPMLFQWASDGFTWDEDEQKRAMILGSLNGIFIIGDGLDYMLRKALGLRTFSLEVAILSPFKDAGKFIDEAMEAIEEDGFDAEDSLRAMRGLAGATGSLTGMPLKQAVDFTKGASDLISGEHEKAMYELLGYTPYTAEKIVEGE